MWRWAAIATFGFALLWMAAAQAIAADWLGDNTAGQATRLSSSESSSGTLYGTGIVRGQSCEPDELTVADPRSLELGIGRSYPDWNETWWTWQILPEGLMYRSYLAGGREPRIAGQWVYVKGQGWLLDATIGVRVGLLRYGTRDLAWPEGWQLDVEGATFPRLDLEHGRDLVSADFRFGVPLTFRQGPWEAKLGYYHLSSHLGDEFQITHPFAHRINYVRDAVVLGGAVYPNPDLRLYGEAGWAFFDDGGSRPWEFQFGADFSPADASGVRGDPFFAVNGRIRQEVNYGGNVTVQTGWQWRGETGRLLRLGVDYFNGKSDQYQFFTEHEQQIGLGLWYDY